MTELGSRTKLINALKEILRTKTLTNTSVSEIISRAGVSRQTFYRNFVDKYDLAFWIYREEVLKVRNEYHSDQDWPKMAARCLEILKAEPILYKNLCDDVYAQNSFFEQYVENSIEGFELYMGKRNLNCTLQMVYRVWVNGSCKMTLDWILGGMKENIDELVRINMLSMPPMLLEALGVDPPEPDD